MHIVYEECTSEEDSTVECHTSETGIEGIRLRWYVKKATDSCRFLQSHTRKWCCLEELNNQTNVISMSWTQVLYLCRDRENSKGFANCQVTKVPTTTNNSNIIFLQLFYPEMMQNQGKQAAGKAVYIKETAAYKNKTQSKRWAKSNHQTSRAKSDNTKKKQRQADLENNKLRPNELWI